MQSRGKMPARAGLCDEAFKAIDANFASPDRNRMLALLLEHQTLDTWMTFQLMEEAIKWVQSKRYSEVEWTFDEVTYTRDQQSSTSAAMLGLKNTVVDSFFNFQSIRVGGGGVPGMRHQNRPDGMFLLQVKTTTKSDQPMVLFYEGDVHGKDDGKGLTKGCKNSHKMYQAIAQAQARSPEMAGCVIFAAMQYAPIDKMMDFLDDMLKAHIFVCIAIADWNKHIGESRRKVTLIGDLFGTGLKTDLKYDFVFGINIGLEQGIPSFNQIEYEHRITEMLKALGNNNSTIEPKARLKGVAVYSSASVNVGCVKIVVCAIPRQAEDVLEKSTQTPKPMFIYPMHISKIVPFRGGTAVLDATIADRVLDISANIRPALLSGYNFKKNMMHMTVVHTNHIAIPSTEKNSCLLSETDGFFYVALPLAYYTIQQFEFVNAVLNYSWSPTRHDFRAMLSAFKLNKKKLTGLVDVTMFRVKSSSLFETICASANSLPAISTDFDIFLRECCRWKEQDDALPGSSPTIFFRTLGIFSLQNAIDFACDIRANPNKTYTSLLASYPAGAQIVIQQCMKRLSGNEAYAYIGRNEDVPAAETLPTDEQVDSDDESANKETLADTILRIESNIHRALFHSTWKVSFPAPVSLEEAAAGSRAQDAAPPGTIEQQANNRTKKAREDALAIELLKAYQKSVVLWNCTAVSWNTQDGIEADEKLAKILKDRVRPLQLRGEDSRSIKFRVPADLFTRNVQYRITCVPEEDTTERKYLCQAEFPETLKLSSDIVIETDEKDKAYETTWTSKPDALKIKFTLESPSVTQAYLNRFEGVFGKFSKKLNDYLLDTDPNTEWNHSAEMKEEKEALLRDKKDEAELAQASDVRGSDSQDDVVEDDMNGVQGTGDLL